MNPYLILQVPPDADDKTIRQAYLEAIKVATPERDPGLFQQLTTAYELIKDERARIVHAFIDSRETADTPGEVLARALAWTRLKPLPWEQLELYLRACAKT